MVRYISDRTKHICTNNIKSIRMDRDDELHTYMKEIKSGNDFRDFLESRNYVSKYKRIDFIK